MTRPLFVPGPTMALGNLSLCAATHVLNTNGIGYLHPDVYAYGRDETLVFDHVSDDGEDKNYGRIHSFIHLQYPNIGQVMRSLMKPSPKMQAMIDTHWEDVKDCVAGFHIRRGTYAKDSVKFGFYPFACDEAVDAMIEEAKKFGKPVFVMSDSQQTKEYFKSKVPDAKSLDLTIGFTACEHSQNVDGLEDEKRENKNNSVLEWFILSKMPRVYATLGGVEERNVPKGTKEGITSTFGYSAALYGDKIPYYVFNDGYIFYPDGSQQTPRLYWSDADTHKYITLDTPTKEIITHLKDTHGMWKVLIERKLCEEAGIAEWCATRVNVRMIEKDESMQVKEVVKYDRSIHGFPDESV
jgi:hypothetical protein